MEFQHFKGEVYQLVCYANHSETGEKLVIYKNLSEEFFARPYDMFFETIIHEGKEVPRFKPIEKLESK